MENYAISVILQNCRKAFSYSRKEVCDLCNDSFSEKTLYRVESGMAKASNDTMERLCTLYKKNFSKLYNTVDMNRYSMLRIYNEIIDSIFKLNLTEAEYKLKMFEKYVEKSSSGTNIVDFLRLIIRKYKKDNCNIVSEIEDFLYDNTPRMVDISIYPLTDMELNLYFVYADALRKSDKYTEAKDLVEKLLKNISLKYHNESIYCDYYALLNAEMALIYKKEGNFKETLALIRHAVQNVIDMGDFSNTYNLYNIYTEVIEEMDFDENHELKIECIELLETMHSICIACGMSKKADETKKRLSDRAFLS